jgi:hypothetical protein
MEGMVSASDALRPRSTGSRNRNRRTRTASDLLVVAKRSGLAEREGRGVLAANLPSVRSPRRFGSVLDLDYVMRKDVRKDKG